MKQNKIFLLTSHPIQYQAPLFKKIAKNSNLGLQVYFCWNFGVQETLDPEFGIKMKWDIPLLDGYNYKFLNNFSIKPSSGFWGQINPGIIMELVRYKPNLLVVFGWNSLTNWLAILVAKILGIKIAIRGESPLNQELLKSDWKLFIKKIVFVPVFRFIDFFLYIGEENRKFYKYYGVPDKKLFFTPYAVDNDFFFKKHEELKPHREELRAKYGFGANDTVLLFVGKLIDKKNPGMLLSAYKQLKPKNPSLKLVFVGDGWLMENLKQSASGVDGVVFVGFKNQTELPEFYTLADIFVLPSGMGETWGLVVNEAMCFGLPVIISDLVGCSSDLGEYIFRNADDLKDKIYSAMTDKNKRNNLSYIIKYSFTEDFKSLELILNKL